VRYGWKDNNGVWQWDASKTVLPSQAISFPSATTTATTTAPPGTVAISIDGTTSYLTVNGFNTNSLLPS